MTIPRYFCWTRFGTEAGQSIQSILHRKEKERAANGGTFFWGIGNALGPSMKQLIRLTPDPEVLFSPIKSAPRPEDVSPRSIVGWSLGETLYGDLFVLPERSLITSRFDPSNPREAHYALVCRSGMPLQLRACEERLAFGDLRNILSGRMIGASQVTSVVERSDLTTDSRLYDIAFRAELAEPFLIRLHEPFPVRLSECGIVRDTETQCITSFQGRRRSPPRQLALQGV